MNYILHYIGAMLPYILWAMPVIAVYRLLGVWILYKGGSKIKELSEYS